MHGYRSSRARQFLDPSMLLSASAAGLVLSGDSGSGKSNLMRLLIQQMLPMGIGCTLIDPHGDLTADVERDCATLPLRLRRKVVILRFAGAKRLPAINPLALDTDAADDLTRRAQIASKVGHVSKILLHSWGERDFNSKPVMFKWVTRCLTMLARAQLTIPDVRHFFDTRSPVYAALTNLASDVVSRMELEELADMRPREREELIASTKNRFLGFLENPLTELVLGGTDQWLSFRQLMRENAIVLVDLQRGGVLRDEDVEIFANLVLNEILYAAFNTPREKRSPHFVFLDELPVFQSSFDLITRALGQVRKFLVRFVCAFQGTQLFAERTQDRLLNALIGQCSVHLLFRHKNPVDARFFADLLHLPSADPWKQKHVLRQEQQYQDGHDLVTLTDESENWSEANQRGSSRTDGESQSSASSRSDSSSRGETITEDERRLASAARHARSEQSGSSRSDSSSTGTSHSDSQSESSTRSTGGGRSFKQTLVPRIRNRSVITSVQFLSLEEQATIKASEITNLPIGTALAYIAGHGISRVAFPLAMDHLVRTPKFAARKLAELWAFAMCRQGFETPERRLLSRRAFEQRLVEYLEQLAPLPALAAPMDYPTQNDNPLLDI
ncbi:MAG: type IV secretory system conjugative DNA transfer family protein [Pirellulaceae bacterium]